MFEIYLDPASSLLPTSLVAPVFHPCVPAGSSSLSALCTLLGSATVVSHLSAPAGSSTLSALCTPLCSTVVVPGRTPTLASAPSGSFYYVA